MLVFKLAQIMVRDDIIENIHNRVIGVLPAFDPMFSIIPGLIGIIIPMKIPIGYDLIFPYILNNQIIFLINAIIINLLLPSNK